MATTTYQQVLSLTQQLSAKEQFQLLRDLTQFLESHSIQASKRSIMELEGLGQEIWIGVDAQEYVDAERDAWS